MANLEELLVGAENKHKADTVRELVQILTHFKQNEDTLSKNFTPYGGPEESTKFVFPVSDKTFIRRFLILGSTTGTYYCSEKELTVKTVAQLCKIIENGNGLLMLQEIVQISLEGRAPRQNPTLFALALCARYQVRDTTKKNEETFPEVPKVPSPESQVIKRSEKHTLQPMDPIYQKALQQLAFLIVPKVCRIPTHLFMFVKYCKSISAETGLKTSSKGWGRAIRTAISNWYLNQSPEQLVVQVTKYRNREGYTHRDLFRLSHIHPTSSLPDNHQYWSRHIEYDAIFKFIVKNDKKEKSKLKRKFMELSIVESELESEAQKTEAEQEKENKTAKLRLKKKSKALQIEEKKCKNAPGVEDSKPLQYLEDFIELNHLTVEDVEKAVQLINKNGFVREHVPSDLLNQKSIWAALLYEMPMTAMIRNLSKMTVIGLLNDQEENREYVRIVTEKLRNEKALKDARIHPISILMAQTTYVRGSGFRGKLNWIPNDEVASALEDAFYLSFHNVTPTNKRYCLAFDVSGSMTCYVMNSALTCCEASAALGMCLLRTETAVTTVAFADEMMNLNLRPEMTLKEVVSETENLSFGGTDCALPMIWAEKNELAFDAFIIYTDNDTWFGDIRPADALVSYRKKMAIPDAKLIVLAMASRNFSIADPSDPNMLDICGLDASVPELIKEFVLGNLS